MPPVTQRQLLGPIDLFIPEKRRFSESGLPREKQAFTYTLPLNGTNVLPAGGAVTIGIPIDGDSDFIAFNIMRTVTLTDNVTFVAQCPATILLTYTGGGNRLMDQAMHLEALAGTGEDPGVPPFPIFLPGNCVLNVQVVNLDTVNAYNVWLAFPGVKIF